MSSDQFRLETPQYVSAYRRRSAPENTSQTEYNIYNFQRTTFSVTSSGAIVEKLAWQSDIEMIQIPKNWRRHVNMDTYGDGYLGYGLVKFAFTVSLLHIIVYTVYAQNATGPPW